MIQNQEKTETHYRVQNGFTALSMCYVLYEDVLLFERHLIWLMDSVMLNILKVNLYHKLPTTLLYICFMYLYPD